MAASLVRTARSFGLDHDGISRVSEANALAMEPRVAALDDEHHPLFLHPGRTVLVLLRDAGVVDPATLAAAAVTESEDAAFRISMATVRRRLGVEVGALAEAVPLPGDDALAEALVTAPEEVRLVALAERLDHLRHGHLRGAGAAWMEKVHIQAESVYLPVAARTHPRLAQRYRHWCRTFARRLG
jgi:hypothetical protein